MGNLWQMTTAEQHYPVHEQELLAIVYALKKWCYHLLGTSFHILTDHQSLHHLLCEGNTIQHTGYTLVPETGH